MTLSTSIEIAIVSIDTTNYIIAFILNTIINFINIILAVVVIILFFDVVVPIIIAKTIAVFNFPKLQHHYIHLQIHVKPKNYRW